MNRTNVSMSIAVVSLALGIFLAATPSEASSNPHQAKIVRTAQQDR